MLILKMCPWDIGDVLDSNGILSLYEKNMVTNV
jgi:hypothetical protein